MISLQMMVLTFALAAQAAKDPQMAPVEIRVVAKKDAYVLDLGGRTPEEFRKLLQEKGVPYPAPPKVELEVQFHNTSDKEVQLWISGDPVVLSLELKGPGAVSIDAHRAFTREFRTPKAVTLAPGKHHTLAIQSLTYGFRGVEKQAYWTERGEYTLTAILKTAILPPPPGTKPGDGGFGGVTLTSKPVKIRVTDK